MTHLSSGSTGNLLEETLSNEVGGEVDHVGSEGVLSAEDELSELNIVVGDVEESCSDESDGDGDLELSLRGGRTKGSERRGGRAKGRERRERSQRTSIERRGNEARESDEGRKMERGTHIIVGEDQPLSHLLLNQREHLAKSMQHDDEHFSTQRRLALVEDLDDLLGEGESGRIRSDRGFGHDGDLSNGDPEVVVGREGEERSRRGLGKVSIDVDEDDGEEFESLLMLEGTVGSSLGGERDRFGSNLARWGRDSLVSSRDVSNRSIDDSSSLLPHVWKRNPSEVSAYSDERQGKKIRERTWNERRTRRLSSLLVSKLLVDVELLLLKTVGTNSKKVREHVNVDGRLSPIPEGLRGSLRKESRSRSQLREVERANEEKEEAHLSMPSSSVERNSEGLIHIEDSLVLSSLLDDGASEIEIARDDGGDGLG